MTAAVDLAAKPTPMTLELAPAVMRHGVQRLAVLGLRWRQVASVAEKRAAETASAMAEAVAVMVVAMEVAVAARWRRQGGLVGLVGRSFARLTSSFAQLTSSSAQLTMHIVHDMHILRTAHRPFSGWRPT